MPETLDPPDIMLSRFRYRGIAALLLCLLLAACSTRDSSSVAAKPRQEPRFISYAPPPAHNNAATENELAMPSEEAIAPEPPLVITETPAMPETATVTATPPDTEIASIIMASETAKAIIETPPLPEAVTAAATPPEAEIAAIIIASETANDEVEQPSPPPVFASHNKPQLNPDAIIAAYETQQEKATTTVSDYFLSPGDVIEISVWGEEMTREVIVPPDGKISYFLIGQLALAGRTMEEVRNEIEVRLAEYILSPKVIVLGKSFVGNAASILGAVNLPGQKVLNQGDRITDLLAKAGGFMYRLGDNTNDDTRQVADLTGAYLSRHGKTQEIDLARLLDQGDMSQNIQLQKGDFLFIPYTKEANVYALGEVVRPMVIHYRENLTLLDAIAHAGGLNKTTYKDEVCIVRGSLKNPEVIRVRYPDILRGTEPNQLLMAGDIVYVPATMVTSIERLSRQIIPFLDALVRRKEAL
jgi:protein involved in polysaccharide export with SLBB domain